MAWPTLFNLKKFNWKAVLFTQNISTFLSRIHNYNYLLLASNWQWGESSGFITEFSPNFYRNFDANSTFKKVNIKLDSLGEYSSNIFEYNYTCYCLHFYFFLNRAHKIRERSRLFKAKFKTRSPTDRKFYKKKKIKRTLTGTPRRFSRKVNKIRVATKNKNLRRTRGLFRPRLALLYQYKRKRYKFYTWFKLMKKIRKKRLFRKYRKFAGKKRYLFRRVFKNTRKLSKITRISKRHKLSNVREMTFFF